MDFLQRLSQVVRKARTTARGAPAPARRPARPAPGGAEPQRELGLDSPEFADRVTAIFRRNQGLTLGSLQVIGLARVRSHFGERWPKVAPRVHETVRQAIERRLADDDLYVRHEDTGYVVVFASLSSEMARLKCALMADEIAKRIFGEAATPELIEVATSRVDAEGNVSLDRIDLPKALEGTMGRAATHDVGVPGEPAPAAVGGDADRGPATRAPEVARQGGSAAFDREAYARELLAGLPPREKKMFSFGRLNFMFRPMWLVKRQIISAHVCVPARVTSEGTLRVGGAALLSSPGSAVNAEYDVTCMRKVGQDLELLDSEGRSAVLVIPVHFISLVDSRYRNRFLEAVAAIPDRLRRKLVFEVISVPAGAPPTRLTEAVGVLKPYTDTILLRVRLDNKDFARFLGLGLYAVGFDIMNFLRPERELIDGLERFAERAAKYGLRIYGHGLRSTSLISAAVCAGFDYIDGDPVTSVLDLPQDNTPFSLEELYAPLARTVLP